MPTIPIVIPSAPWIIPNGAATWEASLVGFPMRERTKKGVLGDLTMGSLALCGLLRLQNQLNFWFICFGLWLNKIPTKVRKHPIIVKATVVTIPTPFSKILKYCTYSESHIMSSHKMRIKRAPCFIPKIDNEVFKIFRDITKALLDDRLGIIKFMEN